MGERIRVLQLVNGEVYAGAERVQELLLRRLDRRRFEPVCVALLEGTFVRRARALGLPVEVLPMRGRWDLGVIGRLAQYIREQGIELVHTHTVRTNLIGRLAAARAGLPVPIITHVHSSPLCEWEDGWKVRVNVQLERLTRCRSNRFLCVSEALKRELLADGVPPERVTIVPNGLEPEWFSASDGCRGSDVEVETSELKAELAQELGCRAEGPWVVMAAWFRPVKGVDVFLEALARLAVKRVAVGLLVGEFLSVGYQRRVEAKIQQLGLSGRVYILGFRPPEEVRRILQAADAAVLPSLRPEGLPFSLLEALALGKPVIASAVGGIPEVVCDGETGVLVPPNDPEALAGAIARVLEDPRWAAALGRAGRELVAARYRAEEMVRRVEAVYAELVGERLW